MISQTKDILSFADPIREESVSKQLDIKIVTSTKEFLRLQETWNYLNDHSSKGNVFISWEWLFTWWEIYKNDGNRSLYILTCHNQDGVLLGIAPFQITNNLGKYFPCSHQLVFLGTGETDGSLVFGEYMDILIKKGYESRVCDAFSNHLFEQKALWDGAKFHQLLDSSHLSKLFRKYPEEVIQTVSENGFRTYIELPETYKDFLMSLHKKMRNNITRTFSRLKNEQEFTMDSVSNGLDPVQAIATLAKLNLGRREDLNKSSVFKSTKFVEFHQKVIQRLLPLNKVQLHFLHFGKQPVAALYSFMDDDIIHAYQSGFEKEYGHRYSLLTTMLTQEIATSIEHEKLKRFNFMYSNSDDTYKKRYTSVTETMYDISYDRKNFKFELYKVLHGPIKSFVKKILNK